MLSIAGFDPSGGAGVLADVKVFEQFGHTGFGVVSALTYQNDEEFDGVSWVSVKEIKKQLQPLLRKFPISYVKIGLIESFQVLKEVLDFINEHHLGKPARFIWDPILKASAGFSFHNEVDHAELQKVLNRCYVVTPNLSEANTLFGKNRWNELEMSPVEINVLVKGGHSEGDYSEDILLTPTGKQTFEVARINSDKHGTGCVLSSAITASLAGCFDLPKACLVAKRYVTQFIESNKTMLGTHKGVVI